MLWSIIICTRNRSRDLRMCLGSIGGLVPPGDGFEVIVVDNDSSDDTRQIVADAAADNPAIVYVREEKLGLSHARNRGVGQARGEFIAFLDDDAWPEPPWLGKLMEAFSDPRIGCVGGRVRPFWRQEPGWPAWLPERLICFFTVVDYGPGRVLHYPDYPAGTNIAIRKTALGRVGGFSHDLGRVGESLLSMEEVDLCLRLEQAGYEIRYAPDAVVHHTVHEERVSREWLEKRAYWQGVSAAIIEHDRMSRGYVLTKLLKYLLFIAGGAAGHILFRITGNQKMTLLCRCQSILCWSYIRKFWSLVK
jgi:GT2 family glycosyltransferase